MAVAAWLAAACSGTASPNQSVALSTDPVSSPSTAITAKPRPTLPPFKTIVSAEFKPTLTIAMVPSTWSLEDDSTGTFILDTGSEVTAADGSRSAVYVLNHGMIAPAGCANPVDKHENAQQMTARLVSLAGLVSTTPKAITIAGRAGYRVEVHVAANWTKACVGTFPGIELLHSLPPPDQTSFDDGIGIGTFTALYLLDRPEGGVMPIQIDDQSGGQQLAAYESLIETIQLQP